MARKKASGPGGKGPRHTILGREHMSARKSAPMSAGGINTARIQRYEEQRVSLTGLQRQLQSTEKERAKGKKAADKASANAKAKAQEAAQAKAKAEKPQCRNPFCGRELTNRYARYCPDRAICQQYRLLQLQCSMNAVVVATEEDEEDNRPLSSLGRSQSAKQKQSGMKKATLSAIPDEEVPFSIPRRKRPVAQSEPNAASISDASSSSRKPQMERDGAADAKNKHKRLRKTKTLPAASVVDMTQVADALEHPSAVSSDNDVVPLSSLVGKKRLHPRDPRKRRPVALQPAGSDSEMGTTTATNTKDATEAKKRRLVRHASADDALLLSASSSAVPTSSSASKKPPTSRTARAAVAAQAAKKMAVELVPLGAANQSPSFAGGGRYVQNGNRSTAQSLRTSGALPRPAGTASAVLPVTTPAAITPTASIPQPFPTQPSQAQSTATWTSASVSTSTSLPSPGDASRLTATVTPSTSPVPNPVTASRVNSSATTAANTATTAPTRKSGGRMSASEYLQKRKTGELRSGPWGDSNASRSASLERPDSASSAEPLGPPSAPVVPPVYPSQLPEYLRSESAPLSGPPAASTPAFRLREPHRPVDPRRRPPEVVDRFSQQRPRHGDEDHLADVQEGHYNSADFMGADMYAAGQREGRHYPPPRDQLLPLPLLPRPRSSSSFNSSSYEYGGESTYFSPSSSPAAPQVYRIDHPREEFQENPSERSRVVETSYPNPREDTRGEQQPDHESLEIEWPNFSYHEGFVSRLLSRFILKFPYALEAIHNKTTKPRKMKFYIEYVTRIQRLCEAYNLKVTFEGSSKAVVTVKDREWLTLEGSSVMTLHADVIKSLLAEALAWKKLKEKVEKLFAFYQKRYGLAINVSLTFLYAWNEFKSEDVPLPCQVNYFRGSRLHHWNFVVGNVELGSGSHEEKRVAFRLATVRAFEFVHNLADPEKQDVGRNASREEQEEREAKQTREREREHTSQSARESPRSRQRSSSRDPAGRDRPPEFTRGGPRSQRRSSSHESSASSRDRSTSRISDSAASSSTTAVVDSSVAAKGVQEPPVTIIPSSDSNSSHETSGTVENDDTGEDMNISEDASNAEPPTKVDNSTAAAAAPTPGSTVAGTTSTTTSSAAPASTAPAPAPSAPLTASTISAPSTVVNMPAPSIVAAPAPMTTTSTGSVGLDTAAAPVATATVAAPSAPSKNPTAKPPPAKRCMMCEMIRMRKPDGERCLRCQQSASGGGFIPSAVVDP